ncbi:hypothetical protein B0H12DRAFT_1215875 [Mycena haematopus]|nr:hypothetical protein B0H12DRAFT_1215875 [Mycena haematopus]
MYMSPPCYLARRVSDNFQPLATEAISHQSCNCARLVVFEIVPFDFTCITGLYATFTGKSHQRLATASAFNSAVTAATFFTIREYLISPTIRVAVDYSGQRRESTHESDNAAPEYLSWSGLRRHNLLDSGLSGAVTGGILRGLTSGRRTIGRAAITAGMACVLLQAAYNELGIQRIKYLGRLSQAPETSPVPPETIKSSVASRILGLLGARPLSDEDLLSKYRREKDKHLKKIQELEQELEMERERERNIEKK